MCQATIREASSGTPCRGPYATRLNARLRRSGAGRWALEPETLPPGIHPRRQTAASTIAEAPRGVKHGMPDYPVAHKPYRVGRNYDDSVLPRSTPCLGHLHTKRRELQYENNPMRQKENKNV